MKVIGFSGYSGSGKTTLIEKLIAHMKASGQRISVVKHAHHAFDIDHPGKDSWRHRQAGAYEVVVASSRRLALVREYEHEAEPTVHAMLAELRDCDWAIVEGFKHAELPKIEVWRAETGAKVNYPSDPNIVAVATTSLLPEPTTLPVLDLDDVPAIAGFLMRNPSRYDYLDPARA